MSETHRRGAAYLIQRVNAAATGIIKSGFTYSLPASQDTASRTLAIQTAIIDDQYTE